MAVYMLVFDKSKAPSNSKDFANWFEKKSKWDGDRNYHDIEGTSKCLSDFYLELSKEYPPIGCSENADSLNKSIDYTIDSDLIYFSPSWTKADEVWNKVEELAQKYDVGYSDLGKIFWTKSNVTKFALSDKQELYEKEDKSLEVITEILWKLSLACFVLAPLLFLIYLVFAVKMILYLSIGTGIFSFICFGIQESLVNKLTKRYDNRLKNK